MSEAKPKLLFLTTQLPYPPVSGGVIKSWRLVSHWARNTDLTLLSLLKNDDANHIDSFIRELGVKINYQGFTIDKPRNALNLLKSYFASPTLNVYRNKNRDLHKAVDELKSEIDIIFIDHYEMAQFVPELFKGPVVLHEHNAEHIMWDRLAKVETNLLKKIVLKIESLRIARAEKRYITRSTITLAAPNDIAELVKLGIAKEKFELTYHLGEDEMLFWPDVDFTDTAEEILFVGTLTWEANIDGLLWWFEEIWPVVKNQNQNVVLTVTGKNPDPRLLKAAGNDPRVKFTGFVEDLRPLYDKARVFIIPLRFGSGIKVKLLNAMYRGVPAVTTPVGIEGLNLSSGNELFYTTDPVQFASDVLTLLHDQSVWTRLRNASRKKGKDYSWNQLLAKHDALIEKLTVLSGA